LTKRDILRRIRIVALSALIVLASAEEAVAGGDAAAGQATFRVCRSCHQVGQSARNSVGPVLNGVVGRKAGVYPGYNYSDANRNSGLIWDEPTLTLYLRNPRQFLPGTRKAFRGLSNEADIANVIAYLKQYDREGNKR
jgi:cytochrome c